MSIVVPESPSHTMIALGGKTQGQDAHDCAGLSVIEFDKPGFHLTYLGTPHDRTPAKEGREGMRPPGPT